MNKPKKKPKVSSKKIRAAVDASDKRHAAGEWKVIHPRPAFLLEIKPPSHTRKAVRKGLKKAIRAYEDSQGSNQEITDRRTPAKYPSRSFLKKVARVSGDGKAPSGRSVSR